PEDLDRRHAWTRGEIKADDGFCREIDVAPAFLANTFDRCGSAKAQRHIGRAENVAGHIAECAAAEFIETTPREGEIGLAVGHFFRDAKPEVPIQPAWNRRGRRRAGQALGPRGAIGPGVNLCYVSDLAIPDHLCALASSFIRIALVAHLGCDF